MHDATTSELRRTDGPLTGPPGALLAVGLAATAGHLATRLRGVGSLACGCLLRHDDLVDQRDVDLHVEDGGWQLDGSGLVTRGVEDVDRGHWSAPFALAALRTMTSVPAARNSSLDQEQPFVGVHVVHGEGSEW
jgi:hypothetical protein